MDHEEGTKHPWQRWRQEEEAQEGEEEDGSWRSRDLKRKRWEADEGEGGAVKEEEQEEQEEEWAPDRPYAYAKHQEWSYPWRQPAKEEEEPEEEDDSSCGDWRNYKPWSAWKQVEEAEHHKEPSHGCKHQTWDWGEEHQDWSRWTKEEARDSQGHGTTTCSKHDWSNWEQQDSAEVQRGSRGSNWKAERGWEERSLGLFFSSFCAKSVSLQHKSICVYAYLSICINQY